MLCKQYPSIPSFHVQIVILCVSCQHSCDEIRALESTSARTRTPPSPDTQAVMHAMILTHGGLFLPSQDEGVEILAFRRFRV